MDQSTTVSSISKTIVRPYGYSESECGYCKGARCHLVHKSPGTGSKSYSLLADSMTPQTYEDFMYRGWRRSGIHLYKPSNFESCCPTLTIRLLTADFRPTKSQQKILKKMDNLLMGRSQGQNIPRKGAKTQSEDDMNALEQTVQKSGILQAMEEMTKRAIQQSLPGDVPVQNDWKFQFRLHKPSKRDVKQSRIQATSIVCAQISGKVTTLSRQKLVQNVVNDILKDAEFHAVAKTGDVTVSAIEAHPPSGQIRCTLHVEDQMMALSNHGSSSKDFDDESMKDAANEEIDKLARWYQKTTGKSLEPSQRHITIETMTSHQSALNPKVHKLYTYYQNVIHNDPDPFSGETKSTNHKMSNGNDDDNDDNDGHGDVNGDSDMPTNPADLDWGNAPSYFKESISTMLTTYLQPLSEEQRNAALENYYSFYQFLVEAPFPFTRQQQQVQRPRCNNDMPTVSSSSNTNLDCGLYHQHYRLGDVLLAVGVVDILPSGLSSVYLFYHPTFSHELVALGKYAILKEIEYARDTLKLPYYYLGYYIESCQKMRYKAEYKPSQLLCPKYFQWVNVSEAVPKLQQSPCHVCPLVDVEEGTRKQGESGDRDNTTNSSYATVLHQLQMDIGAGINVTIDMLQPSGIEVVKPILEEFIAAAGPELSLRCILKLA